MRSLRFRAVCAVALVACSGESSGPSQTPLPHPTEVSESRQQLERIQRALDVGKVLPGSEGYLRQRAGVPPQDERDEAAIALSRTYELQGNTEAAIATLEDLHASRGGVVGRWARAKEVENRLALLVTGKPAPESSDVYEQEAVSAFARALTDSFRADIKGDYEIEIVQVGGNDTPSSRLGTFNVGGAIREKSVTDCPLCEKRPHVRTYSTRIESWVSIPGSRRDFNRALTVFYYDEIANPIPARYERYLPLTIREIQQRLASGEGLIAVKLRDSAPPVVLIAAPRVGQITEVEAVLAELSTLPHAPVSVKLSAALRPREIQSVIHKGRSGFKACYKTLRERVASATGKVKLELTVDAQGKVSSPVATTDAPSLRDPQFLSCIAQASRSLEFPATGAPTKVSYPFVLSP